MRRFLLAVTLLAMGAHAHGGVPGNPLRVAYVEFPPITYQTPDGKPAGMFIEFTRKVAVEAGYEPEFVYLPVSRAYLYLTNGKVDVWPGLTNIPALDGEVLESWASPLPAQLSAWYLAGTQPLDHFDKLLNKTVIVIGGYTYGGLLYWLESKDSIRVTEAPNHRSALDMLKRGRGDYLLDYRQPVMDTLEVPADSMIRESEVRSRNLAWLFSLANPRAAIVREAFDDAYIRLAETGEVPPVRKLKEGYVIPGFPEQYR
ncbi:substrate-binding periplasmic protein [Marinobacter sp. F3R08]|uniref:substrate-binding periplasmic protein n=1 Tax=Marinobacter sp. F3R08 TaxID=2841559 RepID=UPI001C098C96|nr:transporter substrate-binding domain-containing protein [Marinobacter sp. F3R08]MBU2952975.1 transporter substrate-binding domain-containing protein [Marinobacter sp. F3R08]